MGMSAWSTLLRIKLPLPLPVIVPGVRTAVVLIVGRPRSVALGAGGLGQLNTTRISCSRPCALVVGAVLVAALALFIDWLARVAEIVAAPKGLSTS